MARTTTALEPVNFRIVREPPAPGRELLLAEDVCRPAVGDGEARAGRDGGGRHHLLPGGVIDAMIREIRGD